MKKAAEVQYIQPALLFTGRWKQVLSERAASLLNRLLARYEVFVKRGFKVLWKVLNYRINIFNGGMGCLVLLLLFSILIIVRLGSLYEMTPQEIARDRAEQKEYALQIATLKACEKAIIDNAKFPSKADVNYRMDSETWKSKIMKDGKWTFTVKGGADLMNDLGNMIPHRYHCKVLGDEVVSLEIFPG